MIHTVAAVSTPPPPPPSTARALDAQGHALLYAGQVQASIPILRRALAAASPSSLTYAYALFDLAHALRLGGDPRAAVPLLVARLKIPNQTDKVRAELVLALHAIAGETGSRTKPGRGRDKLHREQGAPPTGAPSSNTQD